MIKQLSPIRVMIVDDSVVFRSFIRHCLTDKKNVEIVGTASDGEMALRQIKTLKPDVVTLDVEMPKLDGIEVLKVLQRDAPNTRVVVITGESESSANRTIDALEAGACNFIVKPRASDKQGQENLSNQLAGWLTEARSIEDILQKKGRKKASRPVVTATRSAAAASFKPTLIAIGSSTGGPAALSRVLSVLPADFSVPIVVVQHMPKLFVQSLAARLNSESALTVVVAEEGGALEAGCIYLAPGDIHVEIVRNGVGLMTRLVDGPKLHHCKPAVDMTFFSLARLAPGVKTMAIVLTGMGVDGAEGAKRIRDAKGYVIAQDEQSSAVWGMPGATVKLGAADDVLPLDQISHAMQRKSSKVSGR